MGRYVNPVAWLHSNAEEGTLSNYQASSHRMNIIMGSRLLKVAGLAMALAVAGASFGQSGAKKRMDLKELVIGGGCFWCVEAVLEDLKGVEKVESGYAGGHVFPVTYDEVCTGRTGAAEVVKVFYHADQISSADILKMFFVSHDPTTLNRQGPDSGTQYRSVIFYSTPEEKALAQNVIKDITDEKLYSGKIVTTLEPLENYQRAEEYHQNYYAKYEKASEAERSRMNAGYCAYVVSPKVTKFRQKYASKLKKG